MKNTFYLSILSAGLFMFSCEPEIQDIPEPTSGTADFSTYVALGNSLTAGYVDNALYLEGQLNSYPSIIADQFMEAGGGEFVQPLVPEGNGINGSGQGRLELTIQNGSPVPVSTTGDPSIFTSAPTVDGPYNNLGVPGARSFHLVAPGYGSSQGNPFFARFATSGTTTVVADAAAQNPTFFTLWIGNNDILGYALAGGDGDEITPVSNFTQAMQGVVGTLVAANSDIEGAIANIPDILEIPYFTTVPYNAFALSADQAAAANAGLAAQIEPVVEETVITTVVSATAVAQEAVYTQAFQQAKSQGASDQEAAEAANNYINTPQGQIEIGAVRDQILGNLEATGLDEPLATLVLSTNTLIDNPNIRPAAVQAQIDGLLANPEQRPNDLQNEIDSQIQGLRDAGFYPTLVEGANGFLISDENSPTTLRLATENDLILLDVASLSPEVIAAGPLEDGLVLTSDEIAQIDAARNAYNNVISGLASDNGFAFVDVAALFDNLVQGGIFVDGETFTSEFVLGNAFSLDGVHLTPAGAAVVANTFISAINAQYNSEVSPVNVSSYRGNILP
ncbi:MAG: SGNH/GDSL hydrolase family protein [Cyclobacteriaceae bacterium]